MPNFDAIALLIYPNALDFSPQICKKYFYPKLLEATTGGLIPVLSYERLSGNPHSGGYDSKEIANRLVQVFPDAKILIVIREQKDIILSTYKQYIIEGGACTVKRYLHPPPPVEKDEFLYFPLTISNMTA